MNRVVLFLDSAGGQVEEGDRVIEALNEIKLRHQLITVVAHGKLCASMCIRIFLQGEDCLAAATAAVTPASTAASYIVPKHLLARSIVGRHVQLVEVRKGTINNARFPHASHRFNPLFRDRSGLHSGFRLPGKHHIRRQHLPRGRGTCRMRRLSFDF